MDELHSIENEAVIDAIILLTSSAGGVKTHSFFDSFLVLKLDGQMLTLRQRCRYRRKPGSSSDSAERAHGVYRP